LPGAFVELSRSFGKLDLVSVQPLLTFVGTSLALVGQPFPLVRNPLALVSKTVTLVGGLSRGWRRARLCDVLVQSSEN
jgi:hypothetical protein